MSIGLEIRERDLDASVTHDHRVVDAEGKVLHFFGGAVAVPLFSTVRTCGVALQAGAIFLRSNVPSRS